ncbi:MAPEG family protein [Sphingobium sp. CFD-2]|uniref:MAPEG family protein n=1 Tax=Sphingobium sp. CFD-2 TaxID=2878542 RepID=UPI00214AC4DC|nr:MAPEG family protein [Sphingobium sp. CFD-2]
MYRGGRRADGTAERSNLANLFEMPVLYFALVPLLILTGSASAAQVVLAWIFVALRLAHTVIHIGPSTVRTRARVYIASSIVLFAMWGASSKIYRQSPKFAHDPVQGRCSATLCPHHP